MHCSRACRYQEPEVLSSNAIFVSMYSHRQQQLTSACCEGKPLTGHWSGEKRKRKHYLEPLNHTLFLCKKNGSALHRFEAQCKTISEILICPMGCQIVRSLLVLKPGVQISVSCLLETQQLQCDLKKSGGWWWDRLFPALGQEVSSGCLGLCQPSPGQKNCLLSTAAHSRASPLPQL